jgi:predicted TIM-barrel fold metal-dependent hydrolase
MKTANPAVIITADSHIGPRAELDLRPYVPKAYIEAFDGWRSSGIKGANVSPNTERKARQVARNLETAGHYDVVARMADMDADGVAAEIIYHDSLNGEMMPFVGNGFFYDYSSVDLELANVGYDVYDRWLADAVTIQPERHVGVAYIPLWDIDSAVRAVERVREMGLCALNFPSPRPGLDEYDDPRWEPFWSACESLEMPLCTHAGGAPMVGDDTVQGGALRMIEAGGWPARRAIHRMVFGGVFERHPRLKLVLTEVWGGWWRQTMRELDFAWECFHETLKEQVPLRPSDYAATNVFLGASFPAPFEVHEAAVDGFLSNMMWGSDYPHPEGTWQSPGVKSMSTTREALRYACSDMPPDDIEQFVGCTAAGVYNLDMAKLAAVAARINAPTIGEIGIPLAHLPERDYSFAFRQAGAWV